MLWGNGSGDDGAVLAAIASAWARRAPRCGPRSAPWRRPFRHDYPAQGTATALSSGVAVLVALQQEIRPCWLMVPKGRTLIRRLGAERSGPGGASVSSLLACCVL
jgi:hypothetical protein